MSELQGYIQVPPTGAWVCPYTLKITVIGETLQPDADHALTQVAAWREGSFYAALPNGRRAEPKYTLA